MRSSAKNAMYQSLGGDAVLTDILAKHASAQCNGCGNSITWVQYMDEYLKDVVYFVETYKMTNTPGASSVFSAGITSKSLGQVYGAAYMLKVLRAHTEIHPNAFEERIQATGDLHGCNPDAKIGELILEFKSWSPNNSDTDIGSMGEDYDEQDITKGKSYFTKFSDNSYVAGKSNSFTQFYVT